MTAGFGTGINPTNVAGNVTRNKLGELLAYDANNRQTSYTSAGSTTTYHYDPSGNRVKKLVGGNQTSIYVYDAFGKLAAEYKDSGTPTPGTFYRTVDHLGSTRLVTDAAGTAVENTDYLPFGEEIDVSQGDARHNVAAYGESGLLRHKFTGKERDSESGMDYFLARYYSGPMGRFLSVDPENAGASLADPQAWNGYAYASNSPLTAVDPDGRIALKLLGTALKVAFKVGRKGAKKGFKVAELVQGVKEDIDTLSDPNASLGEKAFATADLVSEVLSPVSLRDTGLGKANRIANAVGDGQKSVKRVPNPGGKLGDAATRARTEEVKAKLEARGLTVKQEVPFGTPGGEKSKRFADVVGTDPETGKRTIVQIGKQTKRGEPIARERRALADISASPDIRDTDDLVFVEK